MRPRGLCTDTARAASTVDMMMGDGVREKKKGEGSAGRGLPIASNSGTNPYLTPHNGIVFPRYLARNTHNHPQAASPWLSYKRSNQLQLHTTKRLQKYTTSFETIDYWLLWTGLTVAPSGRSSPTTCWLRSPLPSLPLAAHALYEIGTNFLYVLVPRISYPLRQFCVLFQPHQVTIDGLRAET